MQPIYRTNQRLSAKDVNELMKEKRQQQAAEYKSAGMRRFEADRPFQLAIYYKYDEDGKKVLDSFEIINCGIWLQGEAGSPPKMLTLRDEESGQITTSIDVIKKWGEHFPDITDFHLCIPRDYSADRIDIVTNVEWNDPVQKAALQRVYDLVQLYTISMFEGSNAVVVEHDDRLIPIVGIPYVYGAFRYSLDRALDGGEWKTYVNITNCVYQDGDEVYTMDDFYEEFDVSAGTNRTYYLVVDEEAVFDRATIETEKPEEEGLKSLPLFTINGNGMIIKDYRGMPKFGGGGGDYEMVIAQQGGEYQLQLKSGDRVVSRLYLTKHSSL